MVTIPIVGDVSFTIWNKAAYRTAGLDPEQGPTTWKQLFENGQKLRGGDQFGYNLPAGKTIQTACVWITLFHSFGGQYFDSAGRPLLDSAASVAAFRFMVENLGKISPPGNLTWDFPEMLASLSTAQAAQGYMWAGGVTALYDPSKSKIAQIARLRADARDDPARRLGRRRQRQIAQSRCRQAVPRLAHLAGDRQADRALEHAADAPVRACRIPNWSRAMRSCRRC